MSNLPEINENNKSNVVKIVVISSIVASIVAVGVTAFLIWKKKCKSKKAMDESVEDLIDETLKDEDFDEVNE